MTQSHPSTSPVLQRDAMTAGLHPESVLGFVYEKRPFLLNGRQPIAGEYQADLHTSAGPLTVPTIELAVENGNSATRMMALSPLTHEAIITQTASTYEEQEANLIYRSGEVGEYWQMELDNGRSPIFRVGDDAASSHDLPIGPTFERWSDPRFISFNAACTVRTLRATGYGPGTHYVAYCPGARNEEVSVESGVDTRVTAAFRQGLRSFVLWRSGTERYDIRVVEVSPAIPQTFGSHWAFDTDLLGRSLHPDVPLWNWLDIGFFDAHDVTVRRVGKSVRVAGAKVTDGVSKVARGLGTFLRQPEHFPQMAPLTLAQALDMMRNGEVKIGGIPLATPVEAVRGRQLIQSYKDREGGQLIRRMLAEHPNFEGIVAFTGGGVIDLAEQIREQTTHRPANLTRLLPPEVARISNVAGIYWLFNLAKRSRSALRQGV
jgi:hypothetical protein